MQTLLNEYIKDQSNIFKNINNFEKFRLNFEARTACTVKTVAKVMCVLLDLGELEAAKMIAENLKEELGVGFPKSHQELMVDAFDQISPKMIGKITDETQNFIDHKNTLLRSNEVEKILADFCAHEMAANSMLKEIRSKFFSDTYPLYFELHLNGTEERHALDALEVVKNLISPDALKDGVLKFFNLQLEMFSSWQD